VKIVPLLKYLDETNETRTRIEIENGKKNKFNFVILSSFEHRRHFFWTEYDDLKNKQDREYSEDSRQSHFFPTKLSMQKKLSILLFYFYPIPFGQIN